MSNINTNGINVNYPVPGINNNSQGFRDNFASIATNLDSAATEITDLQNKVVVKQALTGTTLNNDMANTLISNASTRSFRATTYNLGNALAGTVLVDVSLADVHYGTVAGNTTVNFGSWAPTGTQSNVQVNLAISNNLSTITFSGNVVLANANTNGASTLENFANVGGLVTVTVPNGVSQLNYLVSTTDCGNTLYISPINRPRVATAIQNRSPIPTGFQGDVAGDVAVDANYIYVCSGSYNASIVTKTQVVQTYASGNKINCTSTSGLVANAAIIFSGTSFGNIVAGATYYIKTIPDGANITVTQEGYGSGGNTFSVTNATGTMSANSYNGSTIWQRINLAVASGATTTTGNLTVTNNASVGNNLTVTGNTTSGNFIGTFANGTSNINIPVVDGNINVVVAGTTRLVLSGGGANVTGTANVSGVLTAGGNISTFGTNGVVQANNMTVTGAASGNANVNTITGSLGIRAITSTYTDSTAASSSTVAVGAVHAIGAPVLAASNASVTFTSASTLYIGGAPSAGANVTITNPLAFAVNSGASYFSGNVGLGTSSPNQKLQVNNPAASSSFALFTNATTGSTSNDGTYFGINSSGFSYIWNQENTAMLFGTNNGERMRITAAGDIGIGTDTPLSKLEVRSGYITAGTAPSTGGSKILAGYYTTSTGSITTLGSEYAYGGPVLGYGVWPSTTTTAAFVSSDSTNLYRGAYTINSNQHIWYGGLAQTVAVGSAVSMTELMRINSSGFLGIGASTNSQIRSQLTVLGTGQSSPDLNDGGSTQATIQINSSLNSTGSGGALTFGSLLDSGSYLPFAAIKGSLQNGVGNGIGDLSFSTRATTGATTLTERMRIKASGSMWVGQPPPYEYQFYVFSQVLAIAGQSNLGTGVYGVSNQGDGVAGIADATTGGSGGYFNRGSVNAYLATNTYGLFSTSSIYVNGTVYTSDGRLKENDQPITNALAKIMQLRAVSFDWKKDSSRGIHNNSEVVPDYGFIAQEVETVLPKLVTTSSSPKRSTDTKIGTEQEQVISLEDQLGEHKGIDYSRFVPFLTAAIQEQQALITSLTARIAALEAK